MSAASTHTATLHIASGTGRGEAVPTTPAGKTMQNTPQPRLAHRRRYVMAAASAWSIVAVACGGAQEEAPQAKRREKVTLQHTPWPGGPARPSQTAIVEAFNAKVGDTAHNAAAAALAARHDLPVSAASDAHDPAGVGAAFVEMPDFDGPGEFLAGLRAGRLVGELRPHALRYPGIGGTVAAEPASNGSAAVQTPLRSTNWRTTAEP